MAFGCSSMTKQKRSATMATKTKEVADKPPKVSFGERLAVVKSKIETQDNFNKLIQGAAAGVDVKYYCELLYKACAANYKVNNCAIDSIYLCLIESVALGLPIGTSLGYAYVVPYNG